MLIGLNDPRAARPRHTTMPIRYFALLLLAVALPGQHPWIHQVPPVKASEFPILAWNPSPSDAASLALMREAGLNVSGFCLAEDLDKVQAAGMSCVVSYPPIHEMIARKEASDAEIRQTVAELKARIGAHPAAWGVNLRDEPGAEAMPLIGRIAAELRRAMPETLPYINLFPNYASPSSWARTPTTPICAPT